MAFGFGDDDLADGYEEDFVDEDEYRYGRCSGCGEALTNAEGAEVDDMYVGSCSMCMPRPWLTTGSAVRLVER
jgi:hypothetical protein